MKQIKLSQLESLVARINIMTRSPMTSYTKQPDGKFKANIGNYHLDGAYGGYALHRMHNDGGGVEDILGVGHVPKRELYNMLHSFIRGLEIEVSND